MEELIELRNCIEEQRYADALLLIGELEEMSRDDKVNKIYSYAVILLLHLIKQEAEQRSTRSWEFSICNSLDQIAMTNRRRKSGGVYVPAEELRELLDRAYLTLTGAGEVSDPFGSKRAIGKKQRCRIGKKLTCFSEVPLCSQRHESRGYLYAGESQEHSARVGVAAQILSCATGQTSEGGSC